MFDQAALHLQPVVRWLLWQLRHDRVSAETLLDPQGWAELETVVARIPVSKLGWLMPSPDELIRFLSEHHPDRFEIQGHRIRARYGHSISQRESHPSQAPPSVLFHATRWTLLPAIFSQGLQPMARQHVHLTADWNYAVAIAAQHDDGVILSIQAEAARAAGICFFQANRHVWQVAEIRPEFLSVTGEHCDA